MSVNFLKSLYGKPGHPDAGKLLMRIMLGGILLFHGVHKAIYGIDEITSMLVSSGLPGFIGYGVYVGELIAPAMVLLGVLARPAAFFIMVNMIMAWVLADASNTFRLDDQGGLAIEGLLFYFLSAAAIMLLGAGRYALMKNS